MIDALTSFLAWLAGQLVVMLTPVRAWLLFCAAVFIAAAVMIDLS